MATLAVPDLRIEPGSLGDLDAVDSIMAAAFDPRFGEAWSRAQCAGILPMRGVDLAVAKRGDTGVGFALWRTILDDSELLLLAVHPAYCGLGLGTLLVDHFVTEARRAGGRRLHLEVREDNEAIALYRRAGFRVAGRRPDYYRGRDGTRRDALTFVLEDRP